MVSRSWAGNRGKLSLQTEIMLMSASAQGVKSTSPWRHRYSTMSSKKRLSDVTAVVDDRQEVCLPLDYSFKAVSSFSDLLREKARLRGGKSVLQLEEELAGDLGDSEVSLDGPHSTATALRVNNNMLADWDGFSETMVKLFLEPASHLAWLDLAFNDLKTIDCAILDLPNLTTLYLHGNNLGRIAEVDKLSSLTQLKSLTLHGNPIEMNPGYRQYVLSQLPQLQTLDFSGVTKSDRATADTWKRMIAPKPRTKKEKAPE